MSSLTLRLLLMLTALAVGACRHGGSPVGRVSGIAERGRMASRTILVNPRMTETDTGIDVRRGSVFLFTALPVADEKGRRYSDSSERLLPADADGVHGSFAAVFSFFCRDRSSPAKPADRLRVLTDRDGQRADFLTPMAHVGSTHGLTDRALESGSSAIGNTRMWTAPASGRLHLFVNDWAPDDRRAEPEVRQPLLNNTGALVVTITPLGCPPELVPEPAPRINSARRPGSRGGAR